MVRGREEGGKKGGKENLRIKQVSQGEVYNCDPSETRAPNASSQNAEKLLLYPYMGIVDKA